jgi:hypothetical protein
MMAVVGQGSGTISGDRVRGQLLHGSGGDWLLLRPDGAGQLDVRITIKTDDEALIVAVGVGQVDLSKGWVGYEVYEVG